MDVRREEIGKSIEGTLPSALAVGIEVWRFGGRDTPSAKDAEKSFESRGTPTAACTSDEYITVPTSTLGTRIYARVSQFYNRMDTMCLSERWPSERETEKRTAKSCCPLSRNLQGGGVRSWRRRRTTFLKRMSRCWTCSLLLSQCWGADRLQSLCRHLCGSQPLRTQRLRSRIKDLRL